METVWNYILFRKESLRLKYEHLSIIFKHELRNMQVYCFDKIKQKKYKNLALSLSDLNKSHLNILIKEYFFMCKNLYYIRSFFVYIWRSGEHSLLEKPSFANRMKIVHESLRNLFSGTDPYHKTFGDNQGQRKVKIIKPVKKKKSTKTTSQDAMIN